MVARVFLGQAVHNTAGEVIGDIRDLVFDRSGRISTAVIGVGGYLGMGEKWVGVAFESLTYKTGDKGQRMISVALTKEALVKAPAFVATEKTMMDTAKDKASQLGHETADKAVELKDKPSRSTKTCGSPSRPSNKCLRRELAIGFAPSAVWYRTLKASFAQVAKRQDKRKNGLQSP